MRIRFDVADRQLEFRYNSWTGRATVTDGWATVQLQSPMSVSTHVSAGLTQRWVCEVEGRYVVIDRIMRGMMGGLRSSSFTITVEGVRATQSIGR